ncbi:MAG: hypothetical protein IZT59_05455 [Verrucomicrobia bacterium]|jgi:hypothetical protein|nr:hypothetical protein [Verrucomicrobiota bacterium]|tara:strand:+ start:1796 stop:2536 length:741 start_codon:yes stop_codon:yes gene_type:complete
MKPPAVLLLTTFLLASCSSKLAPEQALRTAQAYTEIDWQPRTWHIRHGKDNKGIMVHTPDTTLAKHGDKRGYWTPQKMAKGMPYKWGGFDTPESFLQGLREGKKAGDIANTYKIRNDNAAISDESVGIDCSGFISRCWGLDRHVSTRDLPALCDPVSWEDLRMGDILLKKGHVLMFITRQGEYIVGYEAGPIPTWRSRRCAIRVSYLKAKDYSPWRYKNMAEPRFSTDTPQYNIDFTGEGWKTGPY